MIYLGRFNALRIVRETTVGLFLSDEEGNEVLLPKRYVPEDVTIGDELTVFCYLDNEERPVATTLQPDIIAGEFQRLRVAEVNSFGAFMEWGLQKHLLVPFREQRPKMRADQWYLVHCYLDEKTNRLVASNRLDRFLDNDALTVSEGEEVEVMPRRPTEMGWEVIINDRHTGLVYSNEIFKKLAIGDRHRGVIKKIRADKKIDVSLQPLGTAILEPAAEKIYGELVDHDGFLPLHDKSDPKRIQEALQMSKKTFKKGIGTLYKARKILIKDDGIHLANPKKT